MGDRPSIPKSVRFEVFKRDSFTCQYCGAKAPDILLELDHIKPIAADGDSSVMNLVTACQGCNAGKGARELDDDSVIAKQRAQIEELNQRRQQLEMMLMWRDEMLVLENLKADKAVAIVEKRGEPFALNELGRQIVERWVKKYPFDDLLSAIDGAFDRHFKGNLESWETAFAKVDGFALTIDRSRREPALRQMYYIRSVLRSRLNYVREDKVMQMLRRAVAADIDIDHMTEACKGLHSWAQFDRFIYDYLAKYEGANGSNSNDQT